MNLQYAGWSRVVLLLVLSALLGCGASEEGPRTNSGNQQPAIDAYDRGMDHAKKGEFDDAIADFTEAIRLDPEYAIAYCDRGVVYRDKGEDDEAISDYTEAIRLDPTHARAYYNRGIVYYERREHDGLPRADVAGRFGRDIRASAARNRSWSCAAESKADSPSFGDHRRLHRPAARAGRVVR